MKEQLENKEFLTNLLREELQACEKQILGLEMSRESENISGTISAQMDHCASDMTGVSIEINRYKGLYGAPSDVRMHWDLLHEASDIDRDSLEFPVKRTWDEDAADSSDSLEDPFVSGEPSVSNHQSYAGNPQGEGDSTSLFWKRSPDHHGTDNGRSALKRNGR